MRSRNWTGWGFDMGDLLSTSDLAGLAGISVHAVRRLLDRSMADRIVRLGPRHRYLPRDMLAEFQALLATRTKRGTAAGSRKY